MYDVTLQERLTDLRKERKLTLEQLAEQTSLSRASLGNYEASDTKDISHYAIVKLAKFYGVTTDYLLGLSELKNPLNADLNDLRLGDNMIELLKSGQINVPLLCELAAHKDFGKLLAGIEIYVDGMAAAQIQNLNAWVDVAWAEIMEKYQPGEHDSTAEMNTLHAEKCENLKKALNRQEVSYVPNAMTNNGGGIFWAGKTARDVAGDHQAYAKAISSFLDETWMDINVLSGLTTTPRTSDTFPTAENRLAKDGTLTHLQVSPMQADEYDQLIADPKAFIANVLLPRKFPYLYEDRESAKAALKALAEERVDNFVMQMGYTSKYIAETYGVVSCINLEYMLNTPLDHLFDYFRSEWR